MHIFCGDGRIKVFEDHLFLRKSGIGIGLRGKGKGMGKDERYRVQGTG
jgi:hypothetical protein